MDITPILEMLERRFSCRLVYHDVRYLFFQGAIGCERRYRNLHFRHPDLCPLNEVARCVQHCAVRLRRRIRRDRPEVLFWRCRHGYFQVVAPVFRDDLLTGVLFAGLWKRPLPKALIREIAAVLPVLAEGLTARMEEALTAAPRRVTLRARVLAMLGEEYAKPLTVRHLAHFLSLSPSRASHVVKEEFGKSFSQLLRSIRLEKAGRRLIAEPLRVSEAARLCGFSSVNYFSEAFQKEFGVSPRVWQKQGGTRADRAEEHRNSAQTPPNHPAEKS